MPKPQRGSWHLLLVLLPLAAFASIQRTSTLAAWPDDFDYLFHKYSKRYFGPSFDWHWFKAQGVAESNLRPEVRSEKGARGIMQILPSTYKEIRERNPHFVNIDEPRWNIAAAIYYDRVLYERWQERAPRGERIKFAFASYNAGYGKIALAERRMRREGKDTSRWKAVAPEAPGQTRHYVRRITELVAR